MNICVILSSNNLFFNLSRFPFAFKGGFTMFKSSLSIAIALLLLSACSSPLENKTNSPSQLINSLPSDSSNDIQTRDVIPHVYYDQVGGDMLDLYFWLNHKDSPTAILPINYSGSWNNLDFTFHYATIVPIKNDLSQEIKSFTGSKDALIIIETTVHNKTNNNFQINFDNFFLISNNQIKMDISNSFIDSIRDIPRGHIDTDSPITKGYFVFLVDDFSDLENISSLAIKLPLIDSEHSTFLFNELIYEK